MKKFIKLPGSTFSVTLVEQLERKATRLKTELTTLAKRAATADDTLWSELEREMLTRKIELKGLNEQRQILLRKTLKTKPDVTIADLHKRTAGRLETLPYQERVALLRDLGIACIWDGETLKPTITTL